MELLSAPVALPRVTSPRPKTCPPLLMINWLFLLLLELPRNVFTFTKTRPPLLTVSVLAEPLPPMVRLPLFVQVEPVPVTTTELVSAPLWVPMVPLLLTTPAPLEMIRALFCPEPPIARLPELFQNEPAPTTIPVLKLA